MKMDDFQYQDIRIYGETVSKGMRECESRYEAIKPFLTRYNKEDPINILDFGANYGYFTWRIKEDYPNAKITMVDSRELLNLIYKINDIDGIFLINRNMNLDEIKEFEKENHFDLILLMSILHHFPDPASVFDVFERMGDTILCEIDYPNHPNFTNKQEEVYNYLINKNPVQINKWIKHNRPIYYFNKEIPISATIFSGEQEAQKNIPYTNKIFSWFGTKLYPGTLNLKLSEPLYFKSDMIICVYPQPTRGGFGFTQMYLNGFPVLAIKDIERSGGEIPYIEIVSPQNLRKLFNLEDKSEVVLSYER